MTVNLEFQWNGPSVLRDFDQRALDAMQEAGVLAERTAQGLSRVRTGRMRDSVFVDVIPIQANFDPSVQRLRSVSTGRFVGAASVGSSGSGWTLIIGDTAPYAVFNELGTVFMSAQPFIRPGGDAAAKALPGLLARAEAR